MKLYYGRGAAFIKMGVLAARATSFARHAYHFLAANRLPFRMRAVLF